MVVHDLDVFGSGDGPTEADTVLVVDPDAVLTCPVAPERLEPIARRHAQVVEPAGDLKLPELAARHGLEGHEALHTLAACERSCVGVTE